MPLYYIVVINFTKPVKAFMLDSPMLRAAKVLHKQGLGRLKEINEKLHHVPASFGPVLDYNRAESISLLLTNEGVITEIQEQVG